MVRDLFSLLFISLLIWSCSTKKESNVVTPVNTLETYIAQYPDLEPEILIACAASEPESNTDFGISVFFLPFKGAQEYRYYESTSVDIIPDDYSQYFYKDVETLPVFNGYLRRFPQPAAEQERWVILNYKTDGYMNICDPIILKQESKPTIYNNDLLGIDLSNPTEPIFSWEADNDHETIIYFQVVSDSAGNLISGTYTYDKFWQFYNLSNVVLNIKVQDPPQILHPNRNYMFTLMGVSEDNWVNLVIMKEFETN